jgi:hypothetical protein
MLQRYTFLSEIAHIPHRMNGKQKKANYRKKAFDLLSYQ